MLHPPESPHLEGISVAVQCREPQRILVCVLEETVLPLSDFLMYFLFIKLTYYTIRLLATFLPCFYFHRSRFPKVFRRQQPCLASCQLFRVQCLFYLWVLQDLHIICLCLLTITAIPHDDTFSDDVTIYLFNELNYIVAIVAGFSPFITFMISIGYMRHRQNIFFSLSQFSAPAISGFLDFWNVLFCSCTKCTQLKKKKTNVVTTFKDRGKLKYITFLFFDVDTVPFIKLITLCEYQ